MVIHSAAEMLNGADILNYTVCMSMEHPNGAQVQRSEQLTEQSKEFEARNDQLEIARLEILHSVVDDVLAGRRTLAYPEYERLQPYLDQLGDPSRPGTLPEWLQPDLLYRLANAEVANSLDRMRSLLAEGDLQHIPPWADQTERLLNAHVLAGRMTNEEAAARREEVEALREEATKRLRRSILDKLERDAPLSPDS